MVLILTIPYVLGVLLLRTNFRRDSKRVLRSAVSVLALASPILILAVAPYLIAARNGFLPNRSVSTAIPYSASPTDFVLPFTGHPVWGAWIGAHFDRSYWVEASLYVGVSVSLLALVAVVIRRSSHLERGTTHLFLAMVLIAFALSLGIVLRWLSQPVWTNVLNGSSISNELGGMIPLPGYFLFKLLPFYSSMRVPMRYGVFVNLFLIVLAGGGAAWIVERFKDRTRHVVGVLLIALVMIDFMPPRWELATVEPRPVDKWLATQPNSGGVVQFPFSAARSQAQIYYTLTHGKPYIGGAFPTPQYRSIKPVLDEFPSDESLELLRELGYTYIVVDSDWYDALDAFDDVQEALAACEVFLAVALDGQYVYRLDH